MEREVFEYLFGRHDLKKQIEALNSHPKKGYICGCCGYWYPASEIFPDKEYGDICEGCLRDKEE